MGPYLQCASLNPGEAAYYLEKEIGFKTGVWRSPSGQGDMARPGPAQAGVRLDRLPWQ